MLCSVGFIPNTGFVLTFTLMVSGRRTVEQVSLADCFGRQVGEAITFMH